MSKVTNATNTKALSRQELEKRSLVISVVFTVVALLGVILAYQITTARARERFNHLQDRAAKIYQIDREFRDCAHDKCLPAGRVRALSVTMAFRDEVGAEYLLRELESTAAKFSQSSR